MRAIDFREAGGVRRSAILLAVAALVVSGCWFDVAEPEAEPRDSEQIGIVTQVEETADGTVAHLESGAVVPIGAGDVGNPMHSGDPVKGDLLLSGSKPTSWYVAVTRGMCPENAPFAAFPPASARGGYVKFRSGLRVPMAADFHSLGSESPPRQKIDGLICLDAEGRAVLEIPPMTW